MDPPVDPPVDPPPSEVCEDPEALTDPEGNPTGMRRCADGSVERFEVVACAPIIGQRACDPTNDQGQCSVDADCDRAPHGKCTEGVFEPGCTCRYPCETDADCSENSICVCAGTLDVSSRCVPTTCVTNADCETESCIFGVWDNGCGLDINGACAEPEHECRSADQCEGYEGCLDWGEGFACQEGAVCGRPLLVEGQPRLPEGARRADWSAALQVTELDPARARFWGQVGALEHASVAGFARFSLQLIALGAPPDLLRDAQTAAADEVEHARLAFGLASAFAGTPVGPGPTQLGDFGLCTEAAEVMAEVIVEGCVGESLGAAEAEASALRAGETAEREVWTRIAADEARHAALGWRTLAWLLERHPELKAQARASFDGALDALEARPEVTEDGLGARTRQQAHRRVAAGVIRPIANRLLL